MKKQLKKCLPKRKLLASAFAISLVLMFLPFYALAEDQTEEEIAPALERLITRAIDRTEQTVDVKQHTRHWPSPEFRDKWSKRTYKIHGVRVNVQKTESEFLLTRGLSLGLRK